MAQQNVEAFKTFSEMKINTIRQDRDELTVKIDKLTKDPAWEVDPKKKEEVEGLKKERDTATQRVLELSGKADDTLEKMKIEREKQKAKAEYANNGGTKNQTPEQLVAGALKEKLGRNPTETEKLQAMKDYHKETKEGDRKIVINNPAPGSGGMQLSPEALQALSTRFSETGEIPGMGMGRAATEARTKVLNQWANDLSKSGTSVQDNIARQAAVKASRAELNKLQGQRGVVMAFAKTAEKNLQLAVDLSEKVDRTGVPVVNRWLLAGKRSIAGDPEVAKFEAALRTGINEYAKVTSSATGGGVTSDQARKDVESMLNSAQTKEQVRQIMTGVLQKDLNNRKTSYDEQIGVIKEALSGKQQGANAVIPNDSLVAGKVYQDASGQTAKYLGGGKWQKQ